MMVVGGCGSLGVRVFWLGFLVGQSELVDGGSGSL